MLRGGRGVLVSRGGNDLDKAVLLKGLLEAQGHEAHLARGVLTAEQRRKLLPAAAAQPVSPMLDRDAQALRGTVLEREKRYRNRILASLKQAGIQLATAVPEIGRPHYYVVARLGGVPTALDPAFPDAAFGQELASSRELVKTVPKEEFHVVKFRVVLESRTGEGFRTQELLALERTSEQLAGRPILLTHSRSDARTGGTGGAPNIQPVLVVQGTRPLEGRAFGENGLSVTFDKIFDKVFDKTDSTPGAVSAEWIEVEVRSPGRPVAVERRFVFDRVAPGGRDPQGKPERNSNLAAWERYDGVPTAFQGQIGLGVSTGPADATAWQVQDATLLRPILASLRDRLTPEVPLDEQVAKHLETLPDAMRKKLETLSDQRAASFALAFQSISALIVQSSLAPNVVVTADGPSVSLVRFQLKTLQGGPPSMSLALDATIQNQALFTPSGRAAPDEMLRASLMTLAVEASLMEEALVPAYSTAEVKPPLLNIDSSATVLDRAEREGVSIKVLTTVDLEQQLNALPAASRRLLRNALSTDAVVIGPERSVGGKYAFLLLDPRTGQVVDVGSENLHQGIVEFLANTAITLRYYWKATSCLRCVVSSIMFKAAMVNCALNGAYALPYYPISLLTGKNKAGCAATLVVSKVMLLRNCAMCVKSL